MAIIGGKPRMTKRRRGRRPLTRKQATAVTKIVKKVETKSSEKKFYDTDRLGSISTAGQVFSCLNGLAQGVTNVNRIGDKIQLTSFQVRGIVTAGDSYNFMRFILFQWASDANTASPIVTDVLDGAAISSGSGITAPYNMETSGTYKVIKDKVYYVDQDNNQAKFFKFKTRKISQKMLKFSPSGNRPFKGEMFVIVISDSSAATHPSIEFITRTYFIDN